MRSARKYFGVVGTCAVLVGSTAFVARSAPSSSDKYAVTVSGGLSFSAFRGYESWQVVSVSHSGKAIAVILANPLMIKAFEAGIPQNGKPFPDGAKLAKIHWNPAKNEIFVDTTISGSQQNADFMEKDSKRFADSGGWGYAAFEYDATSGTFRPGTMADQPPQANDAKCGLACHTVVKSKDYVFSNYAPR